MLAVAAPSYLASHEAPRVPDDLLHHHCIRFRPPSGKLYRWEFQQRGHDITLDVPGALTLNRVEYMIEAALRGLGIAFVPDRPVNPYIADGRLVQLLDD